MAIDVLAQSFDLDRGEDRDVHFDNPSGPDLTGVPLLFTFTNSRGASPGFVKTLGAGVEYVGGANKRITVQLRNADTKTAATPAGPYVGEVYRTDVNASKPLARMAITLIQPARTLS